MAADLHFGMFTFLAQYRITLAMANWHWLPTSNQNAILIVQTLHDLMPMLFVPNSGTANKANNFSAVSFLVIALIYLNKSTVLSTFSFSSGLLDPKSHTLFAIPSSIFPEMYTFWTSKPFLRDPRLFLALFLIIHWLWLLNLSKSTDL